MANLLLIPNIYPGMLKWTCKIMVVEKQNARYSKSTPTKLYRPMVLQDYAGNKVQAMTYDDQIELFGQKMELYGTYLILGAVVKPARGGTNVPDPNYNNVWTLTRSTYLQSVPPADAISATVASQCDLTCISDIYDFLGTDTLFNAMIVVIYKFPRQWISAKDRQITVTELLVVDEGCLPVILTLWETFSKIQGVEIDFELRKGNFPVLLTKHVSCTVFQGIKIGTKFSSAFELNPPGERAAALNKWQSRNGQAIHNMITEKAHLSSLVRIAKPLKQPHLKVIDLSHVYTQDKLFWVEGHISLPAHDAVNEFVGCNLCGNKVNADDGQLLNCNYCGQTNGITVNSYKLIVTIFDDTGSTLCLLFPDEVHKLLSIVNMPFYEGDLDVQMLAERLAPITFLVGLKKTGKDEGGRLVYTFVVACFEEVEKLKAYEELDALIVHHDADITKANKHADDSGVVAQHTLVVSAIQQSSSVLVGAPSGAKKRLHFPTLSLVKSDVVTPSETKLIDESGSSSDSGDGGLKGSKKLKLT